MPLQFTLKHWDRANSVTDTTGDVGSTAVTGPLLFVPTFTPGARLPSSEGTECPRVFPAWLDTDGRLKQIRGGTDGIRLWGNDPTYGIPRFQYHVRAPEGLTDVDGETVPWHDFYFDAPAADVVRNLKDEIPKPGQKFGRGRPGLGIKDAESDGTEVVLTLDDDTEITIVAPQSSSLSAAYAMTFGR